MYNSFKSLSIILELEKYNRLVFWIIQGQKILLCSEMYFPDLRPQNYLSLLIILFITFCVCVCEREYYC